MRRHLFLVSTVVLGLVIASGSSARGYDHFQAFVGLWQAIDLNDGSTQLLSITCSRQSACDVRLNDTLFTLSCSNMIGFARGNGSIERNVLTVDLEVWCDDVSHGTQLNEFVLDRKNNTLTNLNDDLLPAPNVFHRISR